MISYSQNRHFHKQGSQFNLNEETKKNLNKQRRKEHSILKIIVGILLILGGLLLTAESFGTQPYTSWSGNENTLYSTTDTNTVAREVAFLKQFEGYSITNFYRGKQIKVLQGVTNKYEKTTYDRKEKNSESPKE